MSSFRPRRPTVPLPEMDEGEELPERVFYDAAARFLDTQLAINESLDSKASSSFSVGSTVLPVTFGLLSLAPNTMPDSAGRALIGALVAYLALLLCAFRASAFRALEYRPRLDTLSDYSTRYEGAILLRWVASEYVTSTELNGRALERKARWTGWASIALYVEGALLSIAALLTLF